MDKNSTTPLFKPTANEQKNKNLVAALYIDHASPNHDSKDEDPCNDNEYENTSIDISDDDDDDDKYLVDSTNQVMQESI